MHFEKLLPVLLVTAFLASCANTPTTTDTGPQFEEGLRFADEFAKKDAMKFNCFFYPGKINAAQEARKYTKQLQEQDKPETFIKGFYMGYERSYRKYLDLYCEPSRRF
jgi:hypothetical protein